MENQSMSDRSELGEIGTGQRGANQEAMQPEGSPANQSNRINALLNRRGLIMAAVIAAIIVLVVVSYLLLSTSSQPSAQTHTQSQQTGVIERIFGQEQIVQENWPARVARIMLRLMLSALLAALLAFRPRRGLPVIQRNPYVAQTHILLAIIAAALMMTVADSVARALGIFAAASLVRFRTDVRDPKETAVLLISLGIGVASGVGRLEVAIILAAFVLLLLWVLEYYEPSQAMRAMELTVKTRNVDETGRVLMNLFNRYKISAQLREVDRQDEGDQFGAISYWVNLSPRVSVDKLSNEIFSSDSCNVDAVQWAYTCR
jgi:uncharacterized membrane protein YhiD involved in acid resistance